MQAAKRRIPGLLTLREAARRLGVSDSVLVDLVYVHPPVIDVTLVGRAPRVDARQLGALQERLVALVMDLIGKHPALLGGALAIAREHGEWEVSGATQAAGLRAIIANEARALAQAGPGARPALVG